MPVNEEEKLEIQKTIREYFEKRGLSIEDVRNMINKDQYKDEKYRFLNLIIKNWN